ncbi:hypothetical protein O4215_20525 [Rhodococcus maanshanensis]|uniref:hypothetical protein n=1 Tax=Rhodococcus maanshanensis TaxID=183556 RepID=UPI0022B51260|nr:hypothetical protein [Rhodococcus maanshanensis]MCZ4557950.1 hypothetical protein [Rhodococcus maanshanensis]
MSTTNAALSAVETAIAENAARTVDSAQAAYLHGLAALYSALAPYADRRPATSTADAEPAEAEEITGCSAGNPCVVQTDRDVVRKLEDAAERTIIRSREFGAVLEKSGGAWWATGSDVGLTSDDAAAMGPFDVLDTASAFKLVSVHPVLIPKLNLNPNLNLN